MKKQVKKSLKKILIMTLVFSIVFTTCFSHKKMEVKAASVAAALGSYTLYEICLYFGTLAASALGLGYVYENRDDIAELGKTIIDNMSTLPEEGWLFGSYAADSSYVYGTEALQEVQNAAWEVIQGGGGSPKNDDDNDGDGDKDSDDRTLELDLTGYFLTQAGMNFFNDTIKPIYDKWSNGDEDDIVNPTLGIFDYSDKILEGYVAGDSEHLNWSKGTIRKAISEGKSDIFFDGYYRSEDGYYFGYFVIQDKSYPQYFYVVSSEPPALVFIRDETTQQYNIGFAAYGDYVHISSGGNISGWSFDKWASRERYLQTNLPILTTQGMYDSFMENGSIAGVTDVPKFYRVADWIADDDEWKGHLEDIATSLRSLQDLTTIAQRLSEGALSTQPAANEYGDMMDNLGVEVAPMSNPVADPIYYPATNTTPQLDPTVLPNYTPAPAPGTNPGGGTDTPSDGTDTPEDMEIDLDGLLSIFNILFYLIMIIIMLIYLFLACLGFIVMIFRIPSSSAMLPEEMVLGFEHLQTIMIPGMNISIYGFAMALIYMFIIFAVIKTLRHEINNFHFPRAFK